MANKRAMTSVGCYSPKKKRQRLADISNNAKDSDSVVKLSATVSRSLVWTEILPVVREKWDEMMHSQLCRVAVKTKPQERQTAMNEAASFLMQALIQAVAVASKAKARDGRLWVETPMNASQIASVARLQAQNIIHQHDKDATTTPFHKANLQALALQLVYTQAQMQLEILNQEQDSLDDDSTAASLLLSLNSS